MKIAIGNDHRGFDAKNEVMPLISSLGHEVVDLGTNSKDSVDYPDYAYKVGEAIHEGACDRGILICATALGMCIAANKVKGIRAAPCHDAVTAEMSRRHNDANVLCISADLIGKDLMEQMIRVWLDTPFDGGRHARRVEKIRQIEQGTFG